MIGDQLRNLVGHITWAMLPRRAALCVLAATYRSMELAGDRERTGWGAVLRELH